MPDIVFLCETRRRTEHLQALFASVAEHYEHLINAHKPSGLHGVAMLIRRDLNYKPLSVTFECPARSDSTEADATCGRFLAITIIPKEQGSTSAPLHIVGTYVPNAGMQNKHLEYREKSWDPSLHAVLDSLLHSESKKPLTGSEVKGDSELDKRDKRVERVLWLGDLNVALTDVDVSAPVEMRRVQRSGFTDEERAAFGSYFQDVDGCCPWIDAWRQQHGPEACGLTHRSKLGAQMRLDYTIVSRSLLSAVVATRIVPMRGEDLLDHCAVEVDLAL